MWSSEIAKPDFKGRINVLGWLSKLTLDVIGQAGAYIWIGTWGRRLRLFGFRLQLPIQRIELSWGSERAQQSFLDHVRRRTKLVGSSVSPGLVPHFPIHRTYFFKCPWACRVGYIRLTP